MQLAHVFFDSILLLFFLKCSVPPLFIVIPADSEASSSFHFHSLQGEGVLAHVLSFSSSTETGVHFPFLSVVYPLLSFLSSWLLISQSLF